MSTTAGEESRGPVMNVEDRIAPWMKEAAELTMEVDEYRCAICSWPLAATAKAGCVRGNCSYRPDSEYEKQRLRERRNEIERRAQIIAAHVPQPTEPRLMINKYGEIHPECPDCRGASCTPYLGAEPAPPRAVTCSTCEANEKAGVRCAECGRRIGPIDVRAGAAVVVRPDHAATARGLEDQPLEKTAEGIQSEGWISTRFDEFDDDAHPFRQWWVKHGQYMMAGGGRRESIWAARGWIAREQLGQGIEVTGEREKMPSPPTGKETK